MQLYKDYHSEFYALMKGITFEKYNYMDQMKMDFDYLAFMSQLRSKNQIMLSDIEVVFVDESDFNYWNTIR